MFVIANRVNFLDNIFDGYDDLNNCLIDFSYYRFVPDFGLLYHFLIEFI
jgi:hypothetical protein